MNKFFHIFLFTLLSTWCFGQSYIADSLIRVLSATKEIEKKAMLLKEVAFYLKSNNPEKALYYANESLRLSTQNHNKKGRAEAYHTIGIIKFNLADYDESLENYFNALKIREEIQDSIGLGRSYNNIGTIHLVQKDFDKASRYFNNGLQIRLNTNDTIGIIYSYINIGEVFSEQKNTELALFNFSKSLAYAQQVKNEKGIGFASTYLGNIYKHEKNLNKALDYYLEALKIWERRGNSKELAWNCTEIGEIKILQNHYKEGLIYLEKGLEHGKRIGAKRQIQAAYKQLANGYAQLQNFKKAYTYQLAYDSIKDSIFQEASSKTLLELEAKYEANKKEVELLQKNKEINRLYIWVFVIALLLLSLLSWYLYSRYKWQNQNLETLEKANQVIQKKNRELEEYNSELEQLTFIVSHHLKEPLRNINGFTTLIKRRYAKLLDENGMEYMGFISKGVAQMSSLLSDLLYYAEIRGKDKLDFKTINTKEIAEYIVESLQQEIEVKNARIVIGNLPNIQSSEFFMRLLFKNLIYNGLKFNGDEEPVIYVDCRYEKDHYLFSVKDNGIGIDPIYQAKIFDIFKRFYARKDYGGTGIGLAICKQIILKHKGQIWVESDPDGYGDDKGSTFYFTIPIEN